MAKLKLVADPAFKAGVSIPVAGEEPVAVEFTFKHRTKKALEEFVQSRADQSDTDSIMEMASAWGLDEPFTRDNVELLTENYAGAGLAIFRAYVDQLVSGKVKNSKPSP